MAVVNQVKWLEFELSLTSNLVVNINERLFLLSQPLMSMSRSTNECLSGYPYMTISKLLQTFSQM